MDNNTRAKETRSIIGKSATFKLFGFAMIMFYTLLLSVSEHIDFNYAYLISAAAVVLLVGLYARSISRSTNVGLTVAGTLSLLYGYCFFLLQLEDYALVMGSVGLFGVLTVIMYLTRKIDWYAIHQRIEDRIAKPASDALPS